MGDADDNAVPAFLGKTVDFPDTGTSYELLQPLTNYRQCHDGTPAEARIVFTCRQLPRDSQQPNTEELVMKIKVHTTTAAELHALTVFRDAHNPSTPHLVAFKRVIQDHGPTQLNYPLPGGYVTFTVMTKMPGQTLLGLQYWNMLLEEREEIIKAFLMALRSIYALNIEPKDRALRNVLWERETKTCTIIDFELWAETHETIEPADEVKELQRWGLARRPPPRDWWAEWSLQGR